LKGLAVVEWQIYEIAHRKENTVTTHPDWRLLEQQLQDRYAKRAELQKQRDWYSNENQRKLHYASIQKVVKSEFRGPKYEAVNRAYPAAKQPASQPAPLPQHSEAMYKLDPFHGVDAALRKKLLKIEARERAEDEAIQYGPLKARQARAAAKLKAAKKRSRGTGAINLFLGQAIKKK
jgi:hypothetical protein